MTTADDRDGLTEAERRAIDKIRRELDDEFGQLEPPLPLSDDDTPPGREDAPVRDAPPRAEPSRREYAPREAEAARPRTPLRPAVAYGPITRRDVARRPRRRRGVSVFLLGALVGGLAGGVAGGAAAMLWERYVDDLGLLPGLGTTERPVTETPSAATAEPNPESVTVQTALSTWLDATRRGDIDRQMDFYPSRVPVYYTWRDVSRDAVRDEKMKVFGSATRLEITTDVPTVELVDGGRSAIARFRKRYVIEGPVVRRGEVVQELRWARLAGGWRIVSERDAEVLAR